MEKCPVCDMEMRPGMEAASMTYEGRSFHFCSAECKQMFERSPKQYVKQTQQI